MVNCISSHEFHKQKNTKIMHGPALIQKSKLTLCLSKVFKLIHDIGVYRFPVFNFMLHGIHRSNECPTRFNLPGIHIKYPPTISDSASSGLCLHVVRAFISVAYDGDIKYDGDILVTKVPKYNFLMLSDIYEGSSSNYSRLTFQSSVFPV